MSQENVEIVRRAMSPGLTPVSPGERFAVPAVAGPADQP
jgi:hypothetical protein